MENYCIVEGWNDQNDEIAELRKEECENTRMGKTVRDQKLQQDDQKNKKDERG